MSGDRTAPDRDEWIVVGMRLNAAQEHGRHPPVRVVATGREVFTVGREYQPVVFLSCRVPLPEWIERAGWQADVVLREVGRAVGQEQCDVGVQQRTAPADVVSLLDVFNSASTGLNPRQTISKVRGGWAAISRSAGSMAPGSCFCASAIHMRTMRSSSPRCGDKMSAKKMRTRSVLVMTARCDERL